MKNRTQLIKLLLTTLLFSTLVFIFPHPSAADLFDEGGHAFEAGDYKKAFGIFKSLAEQGDARAQLNLGSMYYYGEGVPQDYEKGAKWYRQAAEQGLVQAELNLGLKYLKGEGVPQDYAEAAKWFRKAADQGNSMAQMRLGDMYESGLGVPYDYIEAHKWYNLVASQPGEDQNLARENLGEMEAKLTSAQIAEAQQMAREWNPRPNISR